jgi:hypothetical protein
MDLKKSLGIWLDYAKANIIDVQDTTNTPHTIHSKFTSQVKKEVLQKSERGMHDKEEKMHKAYFNELMDVVKNYESVLLFGPTKAKQELHNLMTEIPAMHTIKVAVLPAEEMTYNQKLAFVRKHFLLF